MAVGKLALEHSLQVAGAIRGDVEDPEMELVVADHIDVGCAAHDAAGGAQVRRPAAARRLLHVEVAQLAQLEGRQVLG